MRVLCLLHHIYTFPSIKNHVGCCWEDEMGWGCLLWISMYLVLEQINKIFEHSCLRCRTRHDFLVGLDFFPRRNKQCQRNRNNNSTRGRIGTIIRIGTHDDDNHPINPISNTFISISSINRARAKQRQREWNNQDN